MHRGCEACVGAARDQLHRTDADVLPEIAHTIERFDRNGDFGHAAGVVAGFQDITNHALVTTDCRCDLRAHVIAGGLPPIHARTRFDPKDMSVALGRRCCGSWSGHGPIARRNDQTDAWFLARTASRTPLRSYAPSAINERGASTSCFNKDSTRAASSTFFSVKSNATISPLFAPGPICNLRQARRFAVPCFSNNHSPAPRNFSPALSTIKCRSPFGY